MNVENRVSNIQHHYYIRSYLGTARVRTVTKNAFGVRVSESRSIDVPRIYGAFLFVK